MSIAGVVPAAGRGERLGPGEPKALRLLAGRPLLVYAVRALSVAQLIDIIVVAAPPDRVPAVRALLCAADLGARASAEVHVVSGGMTRQLSVRAALDHVPDEVDAVLVHDAARPLAPSELVDAVARAVRGGLPAVVPGLPVSDTVKRVGADGVVTDTVDRATLRAVQTPQGFRRDVLYAAHQRAAEQSGGPPVTDDAGLVERLGVPVHVIPGSEEAFKVTTPLDVTFAEALLAVRRGADVC
jgi:2-C-methyl-D-erythritol 4-phosphate cytidylyltransferase